MKKAISILSGFLFAATLLAASPTQQGTYEARIEPLADLGEVEGNVGVPIRGAFGYYFSQNFHVGVCMSFAKKEFESYWGKANLWGLGLYGEFSLDRDWPVVPYIGLTGTFLDDSNDNRDVVLVLTVSPGLKVSLSEYISLSVQANWNAATEDIYQFERRIVIPSDLDTIRGAGEATGVTGAVALRFLL